MAQEIMVAGAIYEDVPSVRLPDSNGVFHPFTDTSDTTAVAADVAQGKTFHLADGTAATGTAAGATLVTKTVTANGTYSAEDDDADGYSEVTVNVSGGGGGGGGVEPKDVNFIDYDGTVLHAYTAAEFAALTALPENPTHAGLVAQGWNWTLSNAQSYVASYGTLTIGQMYVTASGDTELDVTLYPGRLTPSVGLYVYGTVTVNWGDGSNPDTLQGSGSSTQYATHTYAAPGEYTVSIKAVSGTYAIQGTSNSSTLFCMQNISNYNYGYMYLAGVRAVRIGDNCAIRDYAFYRMGCVESFTVPSNLKTFGQYAFSGSSALKAFVFPEGTYDCGIGAFSGDPVLERVATPYRGTALKRTTFQSTGIVDIAIGSNMTSVETNLLNTAKRLTRLVIPENVTSIAATAFMSCYGLSELHFKRSTPATVSNSNAFANLPTDCTIYVPTGSLSAYTSASNYPSSSTYTYVEE